MGPVTGGLGAGLAGGRHLPVWDFCRDLAERLEPAQRDLEALRALRQAGAVYRADSLFEAGADLTDALVLVEQGRANDTVVREAALRVSRLACLLWLSTLEGEEAGGG